VADGLTLETALPPDGAASVEALGPLEVLVAVTALNQARTAPAVVDAAAAGLSRGFPGRKTAVLFIDGGSQDGTIETVTQRPSDGSAVPVASARITGRPGRGGAVLAALAAARQVGARASCVVDAGLVSIRPEWVEPLLGPALSGDADYVSPAYSRALTEGTLTTNLLGPLIRSLFGKRLQEVLGGCAGVSAALLDDLPPVEKWDDEPTGQGAEMRLLGQALAGGHAVMEVYLGRKQLDPGATPADLAQTLVEAVGPLFRLMERHAAEWQEVHGSAPVPHRGQPGSETPSSGDVRPDRMVRAFHLGLKDLLPLWEQVLSDETLAQLYPLGLLGADDFRFPPPLWARVVADFAVAHHQRRLPRDHLLRALTPLYLGRVAAFVLETQARPSPGAADVLERVSLAFEAEKPTLSARWR
jgi:glycosyltransferase involved in cell wall biosynthesis